MTIGRKDFCKSVLLQSQTKAAVEICWTWNTQNAYCQYSTIYALYTSTGNGDGVMAVLHGACSSLLIVALLWGFFSRFSVFHIREGSQVKNPTTFSYLTWQINGKRLTIWCTPYYGDPLQFLIDTLLYMYIPLKPNIKGSLSTSVLYAPIFLRRPFSGAAKMAAWS